MTDETTKDTGLTDDVLNAIKELGDLCEHLAHDLQEHSQNKEEDSNRTKRRLISTINRHIESCSEVRDATLHH